VNETSLLDSSGKTAASGKIQSVVDYVGYPESILTDATLIDDYYEEVCFAFSYGISGRMLPVLVVEMLKLGFCLSAR
jgi:hypothetical protein